MTSGEFGHIRRVDPTQSSHNYEEEQKKRRRKVNYKGRSWEESDEDLPLQPNSIALDDKRKKSPHVYADEVLLKKAEALFSNYTTLEDKIAGILFFETEAYYDLAIQKLVDAEILKWKVGGLVFTKGDYKRQLYLVEHYKKLTDHPLLIGNDFFHSLSYYFRDDSVEEWGIDKMDVKYFSDLGKAVVFQNKRLGVHFQLAEKRGGVEAFFTKFPLTDEQIKAFRKGIRDAHGIIGLFGSEHKRFSSFSIERNISSELFFSGGQVREVFSLKTLNFFETTSTSEMEEKLILALKNPNMDAFLVTLHQLDLIPIMAKIIRDKKIDEKEIDKKLMKILILKSLTS